MSCLSLPIKVSSQTSKYLRTNTIDLSSDLHHEENRKKTFDDNNWNNPHIRDTNLLAKSGFYFLRPPDTVKCIFCAVKLSQFEAGDDIIAEHMKYSQNCPLMRRRSTQNVPIDAAELDAVLPPASYDECGAWTTTSSVVTEHEEIKHPEYNIEASRIGTYRDWPKSLQQKPKQLAECGFFYSGRGDKVLCFSCGLGLSDWEHGDNVWVEHNKFSINCSFLRLNEEKLRENQKLAPTQEKKPERTCEETVEENAYSIDIELSCKICLKERANIALLPCKHVAVCSDCVFGLKDTCPICREKIVDKINLFFS